MNGSKIVLILHRHLLILIQQSSPRVSLTPSPPKKNQKINEHLCDALVSICLFLSFLLLNTCCIDELLINTTF